MQANQRLMDHFQATCRSHGLKITHQRLEIYRALLATDKHPSAESLHGKLSETMPTLSLDTVYRTLATFEELGLVKRVETMGSQARFEAVIEPHHHFFCDQCGRLIDFCWHSFDHVELPEELQGIGRVKDANVVVHGICRDCLDKE
jgi:Fur family peroxide stress response transcriptional regulator